MRAAWVSGAAVVAALAAVPAGASAAVVSWSASAHRLTVTARAGEANNVFIERDASGFAVLDSGSPVTAGPGCGHAKSDTAGCDVAFSTGPAESVVVKLGDRDDVARVGQLTGPAPLTIDIDGGPGRDTIYGGPLPDVLVGGSGRDVIHGGGGGDLLIGDARAHPKGEPDTLDGGPGDDVADYHARHLPIQADLRRRRGPDGDRYTSVEGVWGPKSRDNTLIGDGHANRLFNAGERSECGGGQDLVRPFAVRFHLILPAECEEVQMADELIVRRSVARRTGMAVTLDATESLANVRVEVRAGDPGKLLGHVTLSSLNGTKSVVVPTPRLKRGAFVLVRLSWAGVAPVGFGREVP